MKKQLLIVLSTVLVVIVLSLTGCTKPLPSFEEGVEAGCFDAGGLMGPDGCIKPEPVIETIEVPVVVEVEKLVTVEVPVIQEKIVEVVVTPTPEKEVDPRCPYTIELGSAGEFFSYWDPGLKTCVIDMAEEHRTSPGLPLWEIKAKGLTYEFEMPFNGQINHSAEFIWIDDTLCIPGNPVYCNGTSMFAQGMQVKVSTDAGNNSAGIFLIQQTP